MINFSKIEAYTKSWDNIIPLTRRSWSRTCLSAEADTIVFDKGEWDIEKKALELSWNKEKQIEVMKEKQ